MIETWKTDSNRIRKKNGVEKSKDKIVLSLNVFREETTLSQHPTPNYPLVHGIQRKVFEKKLEEVGDDKILDSYFKWIILRQMFYGFLIYVIQKQSWIITGSWKDTGSINLCYRWNVFRVLRTRRYTNSTWENILCH